MPRPSPPPTAISKWSSRPGLTLSLSPISAARGWSPGCAPTPTSSRVRMRFSPSTCRRPSSSIRLRNGASSEVMAPDIVIIGSGIGGATIASGLAGSGANILILERGEPLPATPHARDSRAIFRDGHYRPKEMWREADGSPFNPGNYYYVGGNSKFYGAVLIRYRREDFSAMEHFGGVSPAWPFSYEEFEPWYSKAEQLFRVRGALGEDPTEPFHSQPYAFPPVPDEAPIARARAELKTLGLHPASLPLGVDIDAWLKAGKTPWDAFPNTGTGKVDAQTGPLAVALTDENITLETGAHVDYLELSPDGKAIAS